MNLQPLATRSPERRSRRDTLLCLAERHLSGWAPTLRASVLLIAVAGGLLAVAAIALGVLGVAAYVTAFAAVWLLPEKLLPERLFRRRAA